MDKSSNSTIEERFHECMISNSPKRVGEGASGFHNGFKNGVDLYDFDQILTFIKAEIQLAEKRKVENIRIEIEKTSAISMPDSYSEDNDIIDRNDILSLPSLQITDVNRQKVYICNKEFPMLGLEVGDYFPAQRFTLTAIENALKKGDIIEEQE